MTPERKQQLKKVFDAIAPGYDGLRFVQVTLELLIQTSPFEPGMKILDVATGTGLAAIEASRRVGPGGRVIGIDLSPEMIEVAKRNVEKAGLANVEMQCGDAELLDFADASFDAVTCASSLFLIPDMDQAVREWNRVLRPGGIAVFSAFGDGILRPLNRFWNEGLQRLGLTSSTPTMRLGEASACGAILEKWGFEDVEVRSERLDYPLPSAEAWWDEMAASMDGLVLRGLTPDQVAGFKKDVLDAVSAYGRTAPLIVEVPVHFAMGWKK